MSIAAAALSPALPASVAGRTADAGVGLRALGALESTDRFVSRHIGPRDADVAEMLAVLGFDSLEAMTDAVVPEAIRYRAALDLPAARSEATALADVAKLAAENQTFRSLLGMGYSDTVTPAVLIRNLLENPGWYTQYTPYQPEISQGRLQALLNFQTMIMDLTALDIANSSLLDEGTAAAEAMTLSWGQQKGANKSQRFVVDAGCHPQTVAVVQTRALPLGIDVVVTDAAGWDYAAFPAFGVLLQYPATDGSVQDWRGLIATVKATGALVTLATDLLALTVLTPPGELGADIAVGNTQRFGVPLGFGGPHAAFMATKDAYKRSLPGRLVGVSMDATGKPALRLALQTREQHIRRDKATSNICTAQVLLAILASLYACYHGPKGLRAIAERVHRLTCVLATGLTRHGFAPQDGLFFDTLRIPVGAKSAQILANALTHRLNLRDFGDGSLGVALDEVTTAEEVAAVLSAFVGRPVPLAEIDTLASETDLQDWGGLQRTSSYLTHPVFNSFHSETEMMRYMHTLQARDLSLTTSMIPLGSCTMKLNAAAEMLPITFPGFGKLHPFAPSDQTKGYHKLFQDLEAWLAEITGFAASSLQPNAGSQGEYTGLQVIRAYLDGTGQGHRNICLIPQSAHGTNPATAVMVGMQVVVVACDDKGNIDVADLQKKADQYADRLAALMVTYPSTHGVFEGAIKDICAIIHGHGGQVYMDGANLNAQVGLTRPGDIGADVCHINLHKTFCIPHGGGGPGMGPICVASHLAPYLPSHPVVATGGQTPLGPVSAAPWGSASILPISWMYIAMMGPDGLRRASQIAILSANYLAKRLSAGYPVLYTGETGLVAHECILDTRPLKAFGVEVDDIAKRLMDFGFHAPTMSFPVAGTLMIEPTESESKAELDRFVDAMLAIRAEADQVQRGEIKAADGPLRNAPHTADAVLADTWDRPYSRQQAAFPAPWTREHKFWPFVARVDNAFGDRNLVCACLPIDAYQAN
jgi:glycine dehydrogenase